MKLRTTTITATDSDTGHSCGIRLRLDRPWQSDLALIAVDKWHEQGWLTDQAAIAMLMDLDAAFDNYWKDKV